MVASSRVILGEWCRFCLCIGFVLIVVAPVGAQHIPDWTPERLRSYAFGALLGTTLRKNPLQFNEEERHLPSIVKGFKDGFTLTEAEWVALDQVLSNRLDEQQGATTRQENRRVAYSLGASLFGRYVFIGGIPEGDFEVGGFRKGLQMAYMGEPLNIPLIWCDSVVNAYLTPSQTAMDAYRAEQKNRALLDRMEEERVYLSAKADEPGVVALPSGLLYQRLQGGNGRSPQLEDQVEIHYHGTLLDKTVFDSSIERDESALFRVNALIEGLQEGLVLMREGGVYRFYIPPELAYGKKGVPPSIPPGAALIYQVTLIKVYPATAQD